MPDPIHVTAKLLMHQLDAIEHQHRSEITPTFGQLQDLFETKNILKRQLDAAAPQEVRHACAVSGCAFRATVETTPGEWHCAPHAEEIKTLRARMATLRPTTPPAMTLAGGTR